ncbi:hypothetical protein I4U23_000901 [Adineta vaga]|nr:hypothetical protein I4U23_000901 [Adineta vaga]
MKDFVIQIRRRHRGPVIHQFNPQGLVSEQYKQPSNDQLSMNKKVQPGHGNSKRERTSMHAFINPSTKHQHESISDYRHSQSAADLFLYR